MNEVTTIEKLAAVEGRHEISSISVTEAERAAGALSPAKLEEARALFARNGYLRIENLFTPAQMQAFDAAYRSRYRNFLTATNKKDKRPLFTVNITGPFADVAVISNPLLEPFFGHFLGEDYILQAMSAVASFPGAPDQHLHRDATQLFGKDNEIDKDLPAYSMTMLVPLIDFTRETGCTRVWPGSHRISGREAGLAVGSLDPEVKVGSVLISDGRVLHRGAANRSNRLRPLFYCTFHRSWYRDFWGYEHRPPILLSDRDFRALPAAAQKRLAWSRDRYRKVGRKYWLRSILPPALRMRMSKDI